MREVIYATWALNTLKSQSARVSVSPSVSTRGIAAFVESCHRFISWSGLNLHEICPRVLALGTSFYEIQVEEVSVWYPNKSLNSHIWFIPYKRKGDMYARKIAVKTDLIKIKIDKRIISKKTFKCVCSFYLF